jgi:hypothetical protein
MCDRLHRLYVNDGDAPLRILHDDVEQSFAVGDAFLGNATEIDTTEHHAALGVDDGCILRWMAEHVDTLVEAIEHDPVAQRIRRIDRLDQLLRLGVEHRNRPAAREAVARFRIDRGALPADPIDFTNGFERVEVEHAEPRVNG